MECTLCNIRSAVGSCNDCHTLVCEECGVQCEHCGKWACPQHVYMTSSGKTLCLPCQEERRARRKRRAEGYETPAPRVAGEGAVPVEEQELEEEHAALTGSVRQPPPPWKLSLYTAGVGIAVVAILFVFPGLRRIPLGANAALPTPYVLLIVPIIATFWGILGFVREEMQEERNKSIMGIGLAVITAILLVVAVRTDPARVEEQRALAEEEARKSMSPAELEQWREQRLQRYQR